ncbi:glycosyltransferase family 4 protein [Zooshikella harenae]|uniref:Glycosyltransferase family 4 protein n=1 Tax=Zooshikella harenae TaxID=2827238 RepID=A0ABS5ZBF4_9GAMM|nr:glycosyltransferase family 4 protein [Zooshikella harenae]MBU2710247.1 glycosyltransferase family 4 protein [Zooshikella harenae]
MNIVFLTKRYYTNKDLILDKFGRYYEIPFFLANKGVRVNIFGLAYKEKRRYKVSYFFNDNFNIDMFSLNLKYFLGYFLFLRKLFLFLKGDKPDLLITSGDVVHIFTGFIVSKLFGINYLVDLCDNIESYPLTKKFIFNKLFKYSVKRATRGIVVSNNLKKYINEEGYSPDKVYVIGNAASRKFIKKDKMIFRRKIGLSLSDKVIGFVGSLYKNRDLEEVLHLFDKLSLEYDDLYLLLAGTFENNIRLPINDKMIFVGNIDHNDMPYLYSSIDVLIIGLTPDGFGSFCYPQKLCEAIACEVPFVAASVGEVNEILKNHPNSLYKYGDINDLYLKVVKKLSGCHCNIKPIYWEHQAEQVLMVLKEATA